VFDYQEYAQKKFNSHLKSGSDERSIDAIGGRIVNQIDIVAWIWCVYNLPVVGGEQNVGTIIGRGTHDLEYMTRALFLTCTIQSVRWTQIEAFRFVLFGV
jgi:hypothetical protein